MAKFPLSFPKNPPIAFLPLTPSFSKPGNDLVVPELYSYLGFLDLDSTPNVRDSSPAVFVTTAVEQITMQLAKVTSCGHYEFIMSCWKIRLLLEYLGSSRLQGMEQFSQDHLSSHLVDVTELAVMTFLCYFYPTDDQEWDAARGHICYTVVDLLSDVDKLVDSCEDYILQLRTAAIMRTLCSDEKIATSADLPCVVSSVLQSPVLDCFLPPVMTAYLEEWSSTTTDFLSSSTSASSGITPATSPSLPATDSTPTSPQSDGVIEAALSKSIVPANSLSHSVFLETSSSDPSFLGQPEAVPSLDMSDGVFPPLMTSATSQYSLRSHDSVESLPSTPASTPSLELRHASFKESDACNLLSLFSPMSAHGNDGPEYSTHTALHLSPFSESSPSLSEPEHAQDCRSLSPFSSSPLSSPLPVASDTVEEGWFRNTFCAELGNVTRRQAIPKGSIPMVASIIPAKRKEAANEDGSRVDSPTPLFKRMRRRKEFGFRIGSSPKVSGTLNASVVPTVSEKENIP